MTEPRTRSRTSPTRRPRTSRRTPRGEGRQERPPDVGPPPGWSLLAGIDAVLPLLTMPLGPTRASTAAEDLRAALAHTAACGDTCRVPEAANSVRLAANLLLAGSTEQARQALRRARADLVAGSDHR